MNINNLASTCAGLLFAAVLGGCGGGGGGGNGDSSSGSGLRLGPGPFALGIHGTYGGTFSNTLAHQTFVLDNEQFYTFYGISSNGELVATGFLQGDGTLSNGSFSSQNLRDFSTTGTVNSGSLSASFNPGASFNGSYTSGTSTTAFASVPLTTSLYNFDTAANLANITGAWTVKDMQGFDFNVTITASGTLTGSSGACSINGTVTPRASGKNVFELALTFGPAPCPSQLAGVPINGVALEYVLANGRRQLVLAGTDTGRTKGAALLGRR
jgi:hypothetical protein